MFRPRDSSQYTQQQQQQKHQDPKCMSKVSQKTFKSCNNDILLNLPSPNLELENPRVFNGILLPLPETTNHDSDQILVVNNPSNFSSETALEPLLAPHEPNLPIEIQNDTLFYQKVYFQPTVKNILLLLGLLFFTLWVIVMNSLTIYALWKSHRKGQPPYRLYLANLALSDVLLGLLVLPFMATVVLLGYFPFGEFWCAIWIFIDYYLIIASSFGYSILMLNHLWMLRWPGTYHRRAWETHVVIIFSTWVGVNISWTPPFFHDRYSHIYPHGVCGFSINSNHYFTFYIGMTGFYMPLMISLIIGIWCIIILHKENQERLFFNKTAVRPHSHFHHPHHHHNHDRPRTRKKYEMEQKSTNPSIIQVQNRTENRTPHILSQNSPMPTTQDSRERFLSAASVLEPDVCKDPVDIARRHFPLIASMLILLFVTRGLFYVYFGAGAFVHHLFPPDLSNGVYWIMHSNAAICPIIHIILDADVRTTIVKLFSPQTSISSVPHDHHHHHKHHHHGEKREDDGQQRLDSLGDLRLQLQEFENKNNQLHTNFQQQHHSPSTVGNGNNALGYPISSVQL